jgi:hypothetical protein
MGTPALHLEDGNGTPEVSSDVVGEIPPVVTDVATRVPPVTVDMVGTAVATNQYGLLFLGVGIVVLAAFLVWYFTQDRDTPAVA